MGMSKITQHATELHRQAVVIDTHSDILMAIADGLTRLGTPILLPGPSNWSPPPRAANNPLGETNQPVFNSFTDFYGCAGQYSLPQWVQGGVTAQVCAIYLEDKQLDRALQRGLEMTWWLHQEVEENPALELVNRAEQLTSLKAAGRTGVILALEGLEPLGPELHFLDLYYKLGLRIACLTHNRRNPYADGPQPGVTTGGLTVLGRRAVRRMALANPLLDFDQILFVKQAPSMFPHMSDQFYGWWSRPGGGIWLLEGFREGKRELDSLPGYRGMGPVRIGNQAYRQVQHDVYGSAILTATHVFFDRRLVRCGDEALFHRLEALGERAVQVHDQPDAGLWELRGSARVHTFSSVMCWAACDRLAKIAERLGLAQRRDYWHSQAERIHRVVCGRAWNGKLNSFVATLDGNSMDASLLLLNEVGFLQADDPRFAGTVAAVERELRHGDFIFRYVEKDDFGKPENAFLICTFWYINALSALGRRDEARALFERLLASRNRHGLLAEHIDPKSGEQWGNFVQTYSMVGLINSAIRLSVRWDQAF